MSQIFDPLARRALARCYANPSRWVPVRLPRLTARVYIAWLGRNVDLRERDPWNPDITRWVRSFVRSCYHNHRWYGDFDGLRRERRAASWDGLQLIFDASEDLAGWRVRLNASPKGVTIPGHKRAPENAGLVKGIRPGGVGTAGGVL